MDDRATTVACWNVFQSSVKQIRYRIKKKFFAGVPADKISRISPVENLNDAQWQKLVEVWSTAKHKVFVSSSNRFLSSLAVDYWCCSLTQMSLQEVSERNKQNWRKVKFPQGTGSRSYVVELQNFVSDGCVLLLWRVSVNININSCAM